MKNLSGRTSIHALLEKYPFLEEYLTGYAPAFKALKNKAMRATVGRVATLTRAAAMGNVELSSLLTALADRIEQETGERLPVATSDDQEPPAKVDQLKEIIQQLHNGSRVEDVQAQFNALIEDVAPSEIAAMEEQLMQEGLPVSEVQRLCDLHVRVFADALDAHGDIDTPPGHPVHTHLAENAIITTLANRLDSQLKKLTELPDDGDIAAAAPELAAVLKELQKVDNHYVRKENELFPALEKHGISGPTQVMWGIHDQIRDAMKSVQRALEHGFVGPLHKQGASLVRMIVEMVYKENKVLFPLSMQTLEEEEWVKIRHGEDQYGYAFSTPAAPWPNTNQPPPKEIPATFADGLIPLRTGHMTIEQLTQMLRTLPVEISFVDAEGYVRFYSDHPHRIFPRMPGVIGRHVENCHPPKSVDMVRSILEHFAAGSKDTADFWIQMNGMFIYISYYAVRDDEGTYLGCLEVTQEASHIRGLEGEKRLLDWES